MRCINVLRGKTFENSPGWKSNNILHADFDEDFYFFITNIKYHRRQDSWNENEIETLPLCHYYHVYVQLLNIKGKMQKLVKQCVT